MQPFKVGPDFIDPTHHTLAAGRTCRNLDTWMLPPERTRLLFEQVARSADVALVEGVMGLFDGAGYDEETGSTAQVAKLLDAPVLLVIDAAKIARSAAALAKGFQQFDPAVKLAGFVVNRVGSESHGCGVASAIAKSTGLPVLGWLPRDASVQVPERHLGLVPSVEAGNWPEFVAAAGKLVAKQLDLDRILALAGETCLPMATLERPVAKSGGKVVLAIARDEAFHFCYEDNLTLLEEAGATLEFFSPLRDERLPEGTAGILLSGGFPELYAEALSANRGMHQALRQAHVRGLPIYAECGGLMVITEAIVDFDGRRFPMVGLLPGHSVMTRRLTLGYRQARAAATSWLYDENETIRGHEFHYSNWEQPPGRVPPAYALLPRDGGGAPWREGACVGSLWASYVHVHFWAKPELARRFVAKARRSV